MMTDEERHEYHAGLTRMSALERALIVASDRDVLAAAEIFWRFSQAPERFSFSGEILDMAIDRRGPDDTVRSIVDRARELEDFVRRPVPDA